MKRRTVLTAMAVTAAGLGAASPLRHVDAADPVNPGRIVMNVNEAAVVKYIAAWNERDAKRRRALVAQTWSEDGSYVGPSRQGIGHDAIIAIAQERSPGWRTGERHRRAPRLRALHLDRRRHGRRAALCQGHRLCQARRRRKAPIGDRLH